jgi:uncharacterized protein
MQVVLETDAMIAAMQPCLMTGAFVFVTVQSPEQTLAKQAISTFREPEGLSLVLPQPVAQQAGLEHSGGMRQITIQVFSALDGVGLTAAVAHALTECSIPCNVVAAYHHDNVFVPEACAEQAVGVLQELQARAKARCLAASN